MRRRLNIASGFFGIRFRVSSGVKTSNDMGMEVLKAPSDSEGSSLKTLLKCGRKKKKKRKRSAFPLGGRESQAEMHLTQVGENGRGLLLLNNSTVACQLVFYRVKSQWYKTLLVFIKYHKC